MTEAEWLACKDPSRLMHALVIAGGIQPIAPRVASESLTEGDLRRFRLLAVACARIGQSRISDGRRQAALDVAELYADRVIGLSELEKTGIAVQDIPIANAWDGLAAAAVHASPHDDAVAFTAVHAMISITKPKRNRRTAVALIRDVFGNPFRPVAFSPEWCTDTAVSLARQMYESRDFSAMPILADALQDAGCDRSDVLDHCRDTSLTHVRGCWVTDLVLGKA
jgi:hypothetical protein